jgi:heme-degrading monooxygenase HmoA
VHAIVWEFEPRAGKEREFEQAYGSHGEWAKLFANSAGYRGTELLKSTSDRTYITIDRWTSAAAFAAFQQQWRATYAALDRQMESLTESEKRIGEYETA